MLADLLTRDQVRGLMKKVMVQVPSTGQGKSRPRGGMEAARTVLGVLRKMINWGIRERMLKRTDNPVSGMEDNLPRKRRRERVLSLEEAQIVWRAVAARTSTSSNRCWSSRRRHTRAIMCTWCLSFRSRDDAPINSILQFDPASSAFSSVASMATSRASFAVGRLVDSRLLIAGGVHSHIVSDAQPIVANGLPLSKLHHAAFDAHLLGVDSNFRIHRTSRDFRAPPAPSIGAGNTSWTATAVR